MVNQEQATALLLGAYVWRGTATPPDMTDARVFTSHALIQGMTTQDASAGHFRRHHYSLHEQHCFGLLLLCPCRKALGQAFCCQFC